MTYLQEAFNLICEEAKQPSQFYVILVESYRAYGGPEEGGWYYDVNDLVAYQSYPTEDLANTESEKIKELAKELEADALKEHGDYCLRTLEWLDARGLEADWLPEPDGPDTYTVRVVTELPTFNNCKPQWC